MGKRGEKAAGNIERKQELAGDSLISCSYCPYHKGENLRYSGRTGRSKRRAKDDRHKNHRRS